MPPKPYNNYFWEADGRLRCERCSLLLTFDTRVCDWCAIEEAGDTVGSHIELEQWIDVLYDALGNQSNRGGLLTILKTILSYWSDEYIDSLLNSTPVNKKGVWITRVPVPTDLTREKMHARRRKRYFTAEDLK